MCSSQGRAYTCFLVGWCTNKSYVIATSDLWLFLHASNLLPSTPHPHSPTSNLWLVALHPCFQPASLNSPLPYTPARKLGKALLRMASRQNSQRSSFLFKKTANHKTLSVLMAQSPKTSQGGASLSSKVWLPFMKIVQPIYRFCLNLQLDNGCGSSHPCPPLDCMKRWQPDDTCHHPHRFKSLLQKVKSGMGNPDWNVSMADIHLWKPLWVYCPGHVGVKGNDQADRLWFVSEKIWSVEKLETVPAGTKPRTSRYQTPGGERHWDNLPGQDETGPLSIRCTLELFQRWCWQNFWGMGWSANGLFWAHRYHWTKLNCRTWYLIVTDTLMPVVHRKSWLNELFGREETKLGSY